MGLEKAEPGGIPPEQIDGVRAVFINEPLTFDGAALEAKILDSIASAKQTGSKEIVFARR